MSIDECIFIQDAKHRFLLQGKHPKHKTILKMQQPLLLMRNMFERKTFSVKSHIGSLRVAKHSRFHSACLHTYDVPFTELLNKIYLFFHLHSVHPTNFPLKAIRSFCFLGFRSSVQFVRSQKEEIGGNMISFNDKHVFAIATPERTVE